MARPRGGDWLLDEAKAMRAAGVDVLLSFITPQEVMEFDLNEEADYNTQLLHLCTGYSP